MESIFLFLLNVLGMLSLLVLFFAIPVVVIRKLILRKKERDAVQDEFKEIIERGKRSD